MSMIKCLECKKKISDKADSCPHCGCPVSNTKEATKKKKTSLLAKFLAWFIAFILYVALIPALPGLVITILTVVLVIYLKFNPKGAEILPSLTNPKLLTKIIIFGCLAIFMFYSKYSGEALEKRQLIARQEAEKAKKIEHKNLRAELAQVKDSLIQEAEALASSNNFSQAISKLSKYKDVSSEISDKIKAYKKQQAKLDEENKIKNILAQVKTLEEQGNYQEILNITKKLKKNSEIRLVYNNANKKLNEEKAKNLVQEVKAYFDDKDYDKVISKTRFYRNDNEELKEFFDKSAKIKSNEILVQLKKVPASQTKENLDLYRELVSLNPDNKNYEAKRDKYSKKYQQEQEIQKARANSKLELIKWSWGQSYSHAIAEGQVKNLTGESLKNIQAVVTFKDKNGGFITSSDALIEYNPILPNQASPFKVYATWNPAMQVASIEFKQMFGGTVPHFYAKNYK